MSFVAELKRRRVIRVALVYAATAFVILQAADLLSAGLALPAWIFAAITLMTVLGFPLALVLLKLPEREETPAMTLRAAHDDAVAGAP